MPVGELLSFNGSPWATSMLCLAGGLVGVAVVLIVDSKLGNRLRVPAEALLVGAAVLAASYIDLGFGAWLAGTLGVCALGVGVHEYVLGRNLQARGRMHTTPEDWAAHFAFQGKCPCADPNPDQPGGRGEGPAPVPTGSPTFVREPVASTAPKVESVSTDAGHVSASWPVVGADGERQAQVGRPAAPAVVRHHVHVSAFPSRSSVDVVPSPRRTAAMVHVAGSLDVLVETG